MIVVHGGAAHSDDFLAACVCIHKTGLEVYRGPFTPSMLEDPETWVLDQGRRWEPELRNFDHHQLEEERCALTMVLDHFYGEEYRDYMPELRFLEILDSYGSSRAAEFVGMREDRVDHVSSPVTIAVLRAFSEVSGSVGEPLRAMMKIIGSDLCGRIEGLGSLLGALDGAVMREESGVPVLDVTACSPPDGRYDSLPTKFWCKMRGYEPAVILTMDSRQEGFYRMVSINTDSVRFAGNPLSVFTHASGFLTVFQNYEDYRVILKEHRL